MGLTPSRHQPKISDSSINLTDSGPLCGAGSTLRSALGLRNGCQAKESANRDLQLSFWGGSDSSGFVFLVLVLLVPVPPFSGCSSAVLPPTFLKGQWLLAKKEREREGEEKRGRQGQYPVGTRRDAAAERDRYQEMLRAIKSQATHTHTLCSLKDDSYRRNGQRIEMLAAAKITSIHSGDKRISQTVDGCSKCRPRHRLPDRLIYSFLFGAQWQR